MSPRSQRVICRLNHLAEQVEQVTGEFMKNRLDKPTATSRSIKPGIRLSIRLII